MPPPLQLFIAYSRKDSAFLDELRVQLTPLERSGKAKIWYDGKIEPGVVWETAIRENLHSAEIILLLVSADAIASDYFYDKELADALARHAAGTARVVPLIVRPCVWQETRLGELQALPKDGKAVTSWSDRDEAYADAVASLMRTIDGIQMERAAEAERQEQERRHQEEAKLTAAQERERRQEAEEAKRLAAAEAERRRQQQKADRLQKAETTRQRKVAATKQREQKVAALGKGVRSPWVWGSGVVGVLALLIGNWICNRPAAEPPLTQQNPDTTALLENTSAAADGLESAKIKIPEQPKKGNENEELIDQKDTPKKEKPAPVFSDPFAADMVRISGGTYKMGDEYGDLGKTCLPVHEVTVQSFYLSRYEVTQAKWRAVMGSDPPGLRFKGCIDCPVENVSWNDVQQFIKKLNQLSGKTYRLPSEAEWEFAARGGNESRNTKYAGSNDLEEVAWYGTNSGRKTHSVGKKQKNELGLYDMSGNVLEWCQDVWHENYEGAPTNGSAWVSGGAETGGVIRGGSWNGVGVGCRVASRNRYYADYRDYGIGFRLAR